MVILIDTNIILDHLISHVPFMDAASALFQRCFEKRCTGYVAAHSITNIFYIVLRKQFSSEAWRSMLLGLCDFLEIAGVQKVQLVDALNNESFDDMVNTKSKVVYAR